MEKTKGNLIAVLAGLKSYIARVPQYAVMLSGPWGVGKTHFCREKFQPEVEGVKKRFLLVSISGVANSNELVARLIMARLQLPSTEILGSVVTSVGGIIKSVWKPISKAMGVEATQVQINPFALPISTYKSLLSNSVILLDDLERSKLEINELVSVVTEIVEKVGCHLVLVCNENEMKGDPGYLASKEKLVGHTFYFRPNLDEIATLLVSDRFSDAEFRDAARQGLLSAVGSLVEVSELNIRSLQASIRLLTEIEECLPSDWQQHSARITSIAKWVLITCSAAKRHPAIRDRLLKAFREPEHWFFECAQREDRKLSEEKDSDTDAYAADIALITAALEQFDQHHEALIASLESLHQAIRTESISPDEFSADWDSLRSAPRIVSQEFNPLLRRKVWKFADAEFAESAKALMSEVVGQEHTSIEFLLRATMKLNFLSQEELIERSQDQIFESLQTATEYRFNLWRLDSSPGIDEAASGSDHYDQRVIDYLQGVNKRLLEREEKDLVNQLSDPTEGDFRRMLDLLQSRWQHEPILRELSDSAIRKVVSSSDPEQIVELAKVLRDRYKQKRDATALIGEMQFLQQLIRQIDDAIPVARPKTVTRWAFEQLRKACTSALEQLITASAAAG